MSKEVFYNIGKQSIDNGLKDFEISSSQDYFILLSAPTNAKITIKLNSVTAPEIPIKENWSFESKDVNKIFISCVAIENGEIIYGQADGNLILKPNPTINKIDQVTTVGQVLGKYLDETSGENLSSDLSSSTLVFNAFCDFDAFEVSILPSYINNDSQGQVILNGVWVALGAHHVNGSGRLYSPLYNIKVDNVRGKKLEIRAKGNAVISLIKFYNKEV